jgi:hypothetical protein
MDAGPDRQRDPRGEHDGPDRAEDRAVDGQAPAAEDADEKEYRQAGQASQGDPTPASSALLHAEGRRDPVDPEDDPGDGNRGRERVHVVRPRGVTGGCPPGYDSNETLP